MTTSTRLPRQLPGWLHDILERHIAGDAELPVLPAAAQRALGRCEEGGDPCAKLRQGALAKALRERVFKASGHQARMRALWTRSVVAAAFAGEIAGHLGQPVGRAFLCGLLHDVGRPVVLRAAIDTLAHRSREPLPAALLETAMDEFHEDVAERVVEAWKLPEAIATVVAHHHDPAKAAPHETLARVTAVADALADWALDDSRTPEDFPGADPALSALGLRPADVEALRAYRGKALEFAEAVS